MADTKLVNNNILHIFIHIGFWCLVFSWPLLSLDHISQTQYVINRNWLSTSSLFIVFYINYFLLVDQYFLSNKRAQFYITNILIIAGVFFLVQNLLEHLIFNPSLDGVRLREVKSETVTSLQLLLPMILGVGMCLGIKMQKRWTESQFTLERIKQSQLNSEIRYLRYQIQPHFLFNTLNNIYTLIDNSPSIAKNSVHSLSKMMRYLLHDSTASKVPLAKEIDFLNRYIDLMQLRFSSNLTLEKSFPIINQPIHIPPLLLITFIENAFKHGIDAVQASHIKIQLTIENNMIKYSVINSSFPQKEQMTDSGIGLENLRKRLELLYPNKFELTEEKRGDTHIATLQLNHKE